MHNDSIVKTVNDLIETCKDGEYGFQACAEHTRTTELRNLFKARALECLTAARELQNIVVEHGGEPDEGGSARGALERGWISVLGTVAGSSDHRMLEAAERGEDLALARYRKALRDDTLPPLVRALVERQLAGVQRNHDQVKALRDRTPQ